MRSIYIISIFHNFVQNNWLGCHPKYLSLHMKIMEAKLVSGRTSSCFFFFITSHCLSHTWCFGCKKYADQVCIGSVRIKIWNVWVWNSWVTWAVSFDYFSNVYVFHQCLVIWCLCLIIPRPVENWDVTTADKWLQKFRPVLGIHDLWAGWDLYRAAPNLRVLAVQLIQSPHATRWGTGAHL
jgi:hypothetical protein